MHKWVKKSEGFLNKLKKLGDLNLNCEKRVKLLENINTTEGKFCWIKTLKQTFIYGEIQFLSIIKH